MPTTYNTNTTMPDISTDAGYQSYVNELLTAWVTQLGLTQTTDICQLTTSNYNVSMTVNAQTATNVLTVNSISVGGNNICVGMQVDGAGITAGTYITAVGTGTGGTGTYTLSTTPGTVAAESMTISLRHPQNNSEWRGYAILRFNDTLQSTSAFYMKFEFGRGAGGSQVPSLLITFGTNSNGNGAISGTAGSRSVVNYGNNTPSLVTNYQSYYYYNPTQGVFNFAYKVGGGTSSATTIGFSAFRSVDNTGAPTADTMHVLLNTYNSTSGGANGNNLILLDYNGNGSGAQVIGGATAPNGTTSAWNTQTWGFVPFSIGIMSTLRGTAGQVFPAFQYKGNTTTPGTGITNALALGCQTEFANGATTTITILGSTSLTYVAVPAMSGFTNITNIGYTVTNTQVLILYT